MITKELSNASQSIITLFKSQQITDPSVERLKFDAAKHILKLGGLEVDRSEVENKGTVILKITPAHAAKVTSAGLDAGT